MEFCKTVKEFDCTKFEEGQLYYIHWHDIDNKPIKAIYLCDRVDKEANSILVKKIVSLQGFREAHTIRFEPKDINCIDEVLEVEFETIYDVARHEWHVRTDVSPQAIQDQVPRIYSSFLED